MNYKLNKNAVIVVTNSNNNDRNKIIKYRNKINNNLLKIFCDYCILITTLSKESFQEKYDDVIKNEIIYCNPKDIFDNSFLIKKEEDKILKVKLNNMKIENIENITKINENLNDESIVVKFIGNENKNDIQKYINYLKYFKNINVDEIYLTNKNIERNEKNIFFTLDYVRFFKEKELNKHNLPLWVQDLQEDKIKELSCYSKERMNEFVNSNLILCLEEKELQELEENNIFYLYFVNRIKDSFSPYGAYVDDKIYIESIIKEKHPKLYEIIKNANEQKYVKYLLLNSNSFLQFLILTKNDKLYIEIEQTINKIESLYYAKLTGISINLFVNEEDKKNKIKFMYELLIKDLNFDKKIENILNQKGEK